MGVAYNIFVAAFAALGSFLFGYDSGIIGEVISPTFKHFHDYFNQPSAPLIGAIVSTFAGGCFFGAWAAGWLADRIGRKRTIQVGSLLACFGCALQASAQNIAYLVGGRIVAGLAIGCLSSVVPLYQSEISPPHMRGFLTGLTQFMIAVGLLVAFWAGYGCQFLDSNAQWRLPLALQIVPAFMLFVGMLGLPFSPRWLIQQGRLDEAKVVVQQLHGTAKNQESLAIEFAEMVEHIRYEQEHFSKNVSDLWATRPMLRRTLTGLAVQICTQLTGINVASYFQPTLYKNLGYSDQTILLLTGIDGALGAVVLIFFITLVIDRVGRKPPLIIGSIGMAISLAIEAAIVKNFGTGSDNAVAQRVGVAFIILFTAFFFNTSFGPIAWIYQSEIFPMRVRAMGTSVCTMANWASNVLISQVSPIGLQNIGWKYYIVFVVTNVVNILIVIFFFPETKGKSLEEMDAVFGDQVIIHTLDTERARNDDEEKVIHVDSPIEEKLE